MDIKISSPGLVGGFNLDMGYINATTSGGRKGENLEGEEEEESHHETEQSHGLGQSEPQDGVGEQLLFQAGVPGVSDDQRTEDGADTSSGPGNSHGGGAGSDELGGGVNVSVDGAGLETPDGGGGWLGHPGQGESGCSDTSEGRHGAGLGGLGGLL